MSSTHKNIFRLPPILTYITVFILTSCGGGESNDGNPNVVTPPIITNPPIEPITDHSGLTPLSSNNIENNEHLSGGDATLFISNEDAFSTRPTQIAQDFQLDGNFTSGDHIFRSSHDGLGPLLNNNTCQGCHINDGRGVLPADNTYPFISTLIKIGNQNGTADPVYGDQIQALAEQSFNSSDFQSGWPLYDGSLNGSTLLGEAFPFIEFEEITGTYPDGETYQLRKPILKLKDISFGPFMENIRFSARVAPQVFGVGLLESIPQENIFALADEDDENNDNISGKPSMVIEVTTQQSKLGRFAYKAQSPSVLQQIAGAYRGDIGITNSIFKEESCTPQQIACTNSASQENQSGENVDITDRELALVEFYNRVLGVPARRGYNQASDTWEQNIQSGRKHFFEIGCVNCHTPRHVTGEAQGSILGEITLTGLEPNASPVAMLSNQTIYPYTDMLLHDMGGSCTVTRETQSKLACETGEECLYVQRCEGLADGLPQGNASASEWKTPPLWGIGLVKTVNPAATFLHDGRARNIEEAILWHGGEAESANTAFQQLSAENRLQILAFIESL